MRREGSGAWRSQSRTQFRTLAWVGLLVLSGLLVLVGPLGGQPLAAGRNPAASNVAAGGLGTNDYFDAIQPSPQGYLIWPQRPIQVYVEPIAAVNSAAAQQSRRWVDAVNGAIADWSPQIALSLTPDRDQANIRVLRSAPPLQWPPSGSRARHAETRFQIFWRVNDVGKRCFWHQQTVFLGDRQGPELLRGTARHELGHALGLWGHSPDPRDALYAAQVGIPPQVSDRDINTLKRLYQQPTGARCLGP
ncbi:MAG: peptidase [Synechococcales cyanobacterium CRU_2_2]|nr:peptidase [Synechococcales cyanobacterium CRU_2_2]